MPNRAVRLPKNWEYFFTRRQAIVTFKRCLYGGDLAAYAICIIANQANRGIAVARSSIASQWAQNLKSAFPVCQEL